MPEPSRRPSDATNTPQSPSLSEPSAPEDLFVEAPGEVYADAVTAVDHLEAETAIDEGAVKRRLGWGFWVAVGIFAAIVILAITANWLPLEDPKATAVGPAEQGPSADHWLGTDQLGRDMLSRVIFGARVDLIIGFSAAALGLLAGGFFGLLAGCYRGRLETITLGATDVVLAFPALVLALVLTFFLGQDVWQIALILGIVSIPIIVRITRANTLVWSQREFVLAAQALGAKNRRILRRDVLPNVLPAMAAFALIVVAIMIVVEASLSFLGISPPDSITWGIMILDGSGRLEDAPHMTFVPCAALFLTVFSLNLAGDKLRAYFDVKEGGL